MNASVVGARAFSLLLFILFLFSGQYARTEDAATPAAAKPSLSWPRVFKSNGCEVAFYQPQIDEWMKYAVLRARCAVEVTLGEDKPAVFGAAYLQANTAVNTEERQVLLSNFQITKVYFPQSDKALADRCEALIRSQISPQKTMLVSLDHMIAVTDRAEVQHEVQVNLAPPPIFHSESPAILVVFMGKPKFQLIQEAGLLFATNTNWDLFLDPTTSQYYLLNDKCWLITRDVMKGPWTPAENLPAGLSKLPADDNWDHVRKNLPGEPVKQLPTVFVSTTPAELILTDGSPQFVPINGTSILAVDNTESDLFMQTGAGGIQYYLLVAGRWFRSASLDGPWSSAIESLPKDFARIPKDDPHASVLSSVPGTLDADAAVLLASVPTKATVNRNELTLTVVYDGAPVFKPIANTSLYYASNTSSSVLRVDGGYYCCQQGVWFLAADPRGPWAVATAVPPAIYTIPPASPLYNVTYVNIYESTPTQVVTGYTSGYTGQYVAAGVVMFGLGFALGNLWDDNYGFYHYGSYYYSYGCNARYSYYSGGYVRAGAAGVYGPYGGAGCVAAYNPQTGAYARGARAYGPYGSVAAGSVYNPVTGNAAAHAGGSNIYGSWGHSVVTNGNDWAQTGHRSTQEGTVAGVRTSGGGEAVVAEGAHGGSGGIAKNQQGDVYVGKDGNLYKKSEGGQWQKYNDNAWQPVEHSQPNATNRTMNSPANTAGQIPVGGPGSTEKTTAEGQRRPAAENQNRQTWPAQENPGERPFVKEDSGTQRLRQGEDSPRERTLFEHHDGASQLDFDEERRNRGEERAESFDRFRSSERSDFGRSFGRGRSRR